MVVIRLARFGSTHSPKYRITVADSRRWVKGKFIEVIGQFNPNPRGQEVKLNLDLDKAKGWISKGAQPSDRVKRLIKIAETPVKHIDAQRDQAQRPVRRETLNAPIAQRVEQENDAEPNQRNTHGRRA